MTNKKGIFVVGASSELGRAYIKKYAEEYDIIYAHCRNTVDIKDMKEQYGDKICIFEADLLDESATRLLAEKIIEVEEHIGEILYLPAPAYKNEKILKIEWRTYEEAIHIQLRTAVLVLVPLIAKMAKRREGRVAFVLSSCLQEKTPKYIADYVTAKYALKGFMKALAAEYADKGICINAVSPSMMETKFLKNVPELVIMQNADANPQGRNVKVEEVLPMIRLLLSEQTSFMTGQNIFISGGM